MNCGAAKLLQRDAQSSMLEAWKAYPRAYDEVLQEVHARVNAAGFATKLDLSALIAWKHVQNATWMQELLSLPPLAVQARTQSAFSVGLDDKERIDALAGLPGFGGGEAFTSVLLTAWRPSEYGVFDTNASKVGWGKVVDARCTCARSDLVVYFAHLRRMAKELPAGWTPRDVDMALYGL